MSVVTNQYVLLLFLYLHIEARANVLTEECGGDNDTFPSTCHSSSSACSACILRLTTWNQMNQGRIIECHTAARERA